MGHWYLLILLAILVGIGFLVFLVIRKFLISKNEGMPNIKDSYQGFTKTMNESLTIRGIIVAIIAMVMLIPLGLFQEVVNERDGLYTEMFYMTLQIHGEGNKHYRARYL